MVGITCLNVFCDLDPCFIKGMEQLGQPDDSIYIYLINYLGWTLWQWFSSCVIILQVYPMYKVFIEPDLETAHIKIVNKFNPFSGLQSPAYILKVYYIIHL